MHYTIPPLPLVVVILYKNTVQFQILYFKTQPLHILEQPRYLLALPMKIKKILKRNLPWKSSIFPVLGKSNYTSGSIIQAALICSAGISSSGHNRSQWPYENITKHIYSYCLIVWKSSMFDTNKFSFKVRCIPPCEGIFHLVSLYQLSLLGRDDIRLAQVLQNSLIGSLWSIYTTLRYFCGVTIYFISRARWVTSTIYCTASKGHI